MLATLDGALAAGPWLLGDRFTMTDVTLGATLRWMLQFQMIEALPSFTAYAARLGERPALRAADAKNAAVRAAHGL
jgi:glutathione S-transferase